MSLNSVTFVLHPSFSRSVIEAPSLATFKRKMKEHFLTLYDQIRLFVIHLFYLCSLVNGVNKKYYGECNL